MIMPMTSIDVSELMRSLGSESTVRILRSFLASINGLAEKLSQSHPLPDLNQFMHLGHRFKSSAALVGAHELSHLCAKLENSKTTFEAKSLAKQIISSIAPIKQEIGKTLRSLESSDSIELRIDALNTIKNRLKLS
jgi:HPt (histidine-containing phosphotransfer) domain-containing protein